MALSILNGTEQHKGNTDRQIGTGSVSEKIYNQYEIGDVYCIEELMLPI